MGIKFNADEVFQIAIRSEANAAAFYRKAAELHAARNPECVPFLNAMARMEDDHETIFANLRDALSAASDNTEASTNDPYMEATLYLQALTDGTAPEGCPQDAEKLTGNESLKDLLLTSIQMEKDAIVFYLALRDLVPADEGRDNVSTIITEEKSHIVTLAGELRKLGL